MDRVHKTDVQAPLHVVDRDANMPNVGFGGLRRVPGRLAAGVGVMLALLAAVAGADEGASLPHAPAGELAPVGEHGAAETAAPETFVVLDLVGEALEAGVIGIGVKIAELKPKVEHINTLYGNGQRHEAFAKVLGISTEVVLLGFMIETFGISELFVSALSFSGGWAGQFAQSTAGIMLSTKASLVAGEKVEEAAEEKYEHEIHAEAQAHQGRATHAPSVHPVAVEAVD